MRGSARYAVVALLLAGCLSVGAQYMEHAMHLDPCPLCLMQRIWVIVAGLLTVAALADTPRRIAYPIAVGIASVTGAAFSVRQLYLQNLPADEVPTCGPDFGYMLEAFPLADVLRAMTLGTGNCAEIDRVLGVSIAAWSLLGFAALTATAVLWGRRAG